MCLKIYEIAFSYSFQMHEQIGFMQENMLIKWYHVLKFLTCVLKIDCLRKIDLL